MSNLLDSESRPYKHEEKLTYSDSVTYYLYPFKYAILASTLEKNLRIKRGQKYFQLQIFL